MPGPGWIPRTGMRTGGCPDFYHRVGVRSRAELRPAGLRRRPVDLRTKGERRPRRTVAHRLCSPQRGRLWRGQRQNYLTTHCTAHRPTRVNENLAALQRARPEAKKRSCALCPEMM